MALHDEAGEAVLDHLRHRAAVIGHHRRAAGHGLDHHQAEGLGPVHREQQRRGLAEELGLPLAPDLAHVFDQRVVQQRLDHLVEIGAVGRIDLGGDLQRHAQRLGDGDGAIRTLLGRDTAQEGKIAAVAGAEAIKAGLQSVQHRPGPVGPGHGAALVVGDRHQLELRPAAVDGGQVLQVEPAVQGGQGAFGHVLEEGEMDHVGVEVDEVELARAATHLVQHGHVGGEIGLQGRGIEPDGLVTDRRQPGPGLGFRAGEQSDVVSQVHQGVAQVRDHALGAPVELRRNRFVERGDLSDVQFGMPFGGLAPPSSSLAERREARGRFPPWRDFEPRPSFAHGLGAGANRMPALALVARGWPCGAVAGRSFR